ncbi:methyltransferase [Periconia macrospinosa]|uniref:Methyltransferase n=1 Tax=Periconia macrospinosa TaxID=97972 RepID=A0A2V1DU09_9PLEO|nr:methyltransferase [Periconia macrospinosa]
MAPAATTPSDVGDFWEPQAYSTSAPFVATSSPTLVQLLQAHGSERILDVGCGDGEFTANFIDSAGFVLGIDASAKMIKAAKSRFGSEKAEFRVVDCRYLDKEPPIVDGSWDKVITNSALHWILRDEETRMPTFKAIHAALKQNGRFYFEFGGHGHVSEAFTALLSMLVQHGYSMEEAKAINRWFFPSKEWTQHMLEKAGFAVEMIEVEYRPTKLTDVDEGGLAGWIQLLGAPMINAIPAAQRSQAVKQVCEILDPVVTKPEDGSKWLGYVRLRGVARKS